MAMTMERTDNLAHGVHHIAIGVKSLRSMRSFYEKVLEFNHVLAEFPRGRHESLEEIFRMSPVEFAGVIFRQEAGGIFVELIEIVNPPPRHIHSDFRYGDIGVNKVTIAVPDVGQFYLEMKNQINFCAEPKITGLPAWGDLHFVYCKDPEGNLIEFVSEPDMKIQNKYGGARWLGVGVSDLQRSKSFYQKLGFNKIVIEPHEMFSGFLDDVIGEKNTQIRSCLLANSKNPGMLEIFEVMKPRGRSVPFFTHWGDFGYLQISLNAMDISAIETYCQKERIETLCKPQKADDKLAPSLMYFKDPDGIPVSCMVFS